MTDVVEESNDENKGKALVPDEISDWGNEVTFTEPKLKTESGEQERGTEEPEVEEPEAPVAPEVAPVVQAPIVNDPGEFKPNDYSFEVTIKGKATKIATVEEADALAADPDNFDTPQQLMDFIRKSNKLENGIEKDKQAWEQSKASFDKQQADYETRMEEVNTVAAEIEYLVQKGDLPPVADEYKSANWKDPIVAAQPGVREQLALLTYRNEENARREKAGLKSKVSALDAFNGWQIETAKDKAAKDNKTAGEQRRAASAKVASSSAGPVSNKPKGISVGRVGDLNNLSANW